MASRLRHRALHTNPHQPRAFAELFVHSPIPSQNCSSLSSFLVTSSSSISCGSRVCLLQASSLSFLCYRNNMSIMCYTQHGVRLRCGLEVRLIEGCYGPMLFCRPGTRHTADVGFRCEQDRPPRTWSTPLFTHSLQLLPSSTTSAISWSHRPHQANDVKHRGLPSSYCASRGSTWDIPDYPLSELSRIGRCFWAYLSDNAAIATITGHCCLCERTD